MRQVLVARCEARGRSVVRVFLPRGPFGTCPRCGWQGATLAANRRPNKGHKLGHEVRLLREQAVVPSRGRRTVGRSECGRNRRDNASRVSIFYKVIAAERQGSATGAMCPADRWLFRSDRLASKLAPFCCEQCAGESGAFGRGLRRPYSTRICLPGSPG